MDFFGLCSISRAINDPKHPLKGIASNQCLIFAKVNKNQEKTAPLIQYGYRQLTNGIKF